MTRYFFEYNNGIVMHKLAVDRSDWFGVQISQSLHEVDEATFVATPEGSLANEDGTYTPPAPVPVVRRLSKFAFLRLLTPTEYSAMFGQQSDQMLAYGVAMFQAAPDPFNIDDPIVSQMLDYCVQVGALTAERRTALWSAMEAAAS